MNVLYVDLEHRRVVDDPIGGASHAQRVATARARIALAAGESCDVMRFEDVTPDRVRDLHPMALVISGNVTDWGDYDFAELAGLMQSIRAAPVPILGICGGHQLIGHAHGARWGPIGALRDGSIDPDPRFAPGLRKERGHLEIDIDPTSALFRGLGVRPVVFQSHYWHLLDVPVGFTCCASSRDSPIQAIARQERPAFGVQFHPERYDADHRDGEAVLRNFFSVARARQTSLASLPREANAKAHDRSDEFAEPRAGSVCT